MATPETPGAAIFLYKNKCFRNDFPGRSPQSANTVRKERRGEAQRENTVRRERPGEGTRPYGESRITVYPLSPRCRALSCAETEREANPKRRRRAFDDNAVLIASPAP